MANSEYTHVVEAKSKTGDWKPMTKHIGEADAKKSIADMKGKVNTSNYRVVPFGAKPAAKPATKAAAKPVAKAAAKPAAKKASK
jgi:hypothetical protein